METATLGGMTTATHPQHPHRRARATVADVAAAALRPDDGDCDPAVPVVTVAELRRRGITPSTITKRCRPGGPWRRLAKGVILLGTGRPTREQLLRATVLYLGPGCALTGVDALAAQGVPLPPSDTVPALVPEHRRVLPPRFTTVERTSRPPEPVRIDGLPFAPPPRATVDAARGESDEHRLRRILTQPVQEGLCTLAELREELDAGNQRGSAAVRAQLRVLGRTDLGRGRRPARQLLARCPVPPPRWDTVVRDAHGRRLGAVDAWWDEIGLGWVLTAPGTDTGNGVPPAVRPEETRGHDHRREHLALTAAGVIVVRTPLPSLHRDDDRVRADLVRAFHRAATRPRPRVRGESARAAA